MFCPKCGTEMPDSAEFCMKCGYSLGGIKKPAVVSGSIEQQMNTREESINTLNKIYSYFSKKGALYDEYDELQKKVDQCIKAKHTGYLIVGIIFIVFGTPTIFRTSLPIVIESIPNDWDSIPSWAIPYVILYLLLLLSPIIIGVILLLAQSSKKKKDYKHAADISKRIQEISKDLSDYYDDFGPCIIGKEFSNPRIISVIVGLIKSGRADTPKEAINVMLDDAHKTNLQLQAELQTKALKSIKTSSAISAGANVATAGFVGADFFGNLIGF